MQVGDTRARLLQAALERFAGHGYDATGVQDIVLAAGVTKPSLYHHFGSKMGLLEALLDEGARPLLTALRQATASAHDVTQTLDRVAEVYLSFASRQPTFYRFLLSLIFAPPEHEARRAAARLFDEQQQVLEGLFRAAAPDHGAFRGRHRRYAVSFLAVLNGYGMLVLNGEAVPDERLRYDLVHQFSHGIYS